ncbi:MoeB/ThiF family adenylyltransferase [Salipaludibacillus sp. CF4.18]|uniref:MoeB/ThiF family adenylyltransferase n=1 Tax=Salipaludibacillus sp. CF4.18 TaxID=3373081 RepID=UPI003EE7674B
METRYSRQTLFKPIGEKGQHLLQQKHVLIIGAGALGTGNAENLVRAGVGTVTIVDRDYVEKSNLQRQQLYSEQDAFERLPKAVAAKTRLEAINSQVDIRAHVLDIRKEELEGLLKGIDLLIDATDNFDTRLIINDLTQKNDIPWIYGACVGSYGLSFTVIPKDTPCLHCLMETIPLGGATCDTAGIIAPAVQMVVAHQTTEAMKLLVNDKASLRKRLISFDLWKNEQSTIDVSSLKNEHCLSCGTNPTYPFLSFEKQLKSSVLCGRDSVQIRPSDNMTRDLQALKEQLSHLEGKVESNPYLVTFFHQKHRLVFFLDGRVLIHGTSDISEARTIYHQIIG